ncbi:MAG TPA: MaoC/PaaZ C-terminal domain-containing protein [Solirubrobacterales bacterium]|nr:MaoC/PaaZ C-terminal domain-containing protein [Solirubrobacterales bacterium]
MRTRTLDSPPSILPLYARAALPLIPGASLLPFVPGRGREIPETELVLEGVRPDPDAVTAYARVCGFSLRDTLPPTYPHILAFPLHMATMADSSFPFGAVGLVHVENRIVQRRPIGIGEELKLVVRPTPLQPHKRGQTFGLLTEAQIGEETAWESTSTFLRRGPSQTAVEVESGMRTKPLRRDAEGGAVDAPEPEEGLTASATWRLGGDLGRRYAAVSGDRNPIHMHSLTAKPLGFPSAIAHGMWTKARCLAALGGRLPDAFAVEVGFRKPIRLPGAVEFLSDADGEEIDFAVRDAKRHTPHLDGRLTPLEAKAGPKQTTGRKSK